MAFTEFCCRSGGSNLNAGTRTGSSTEPGTAADLTYASGTWVSATGVFTVAAGDPIADGVAVGDFASVYADGATVTTLVGRVTARTTTTITVSTTAKTGTTTDGTNTRTLKIGGAWLGPNGASGFPMNFLTTACSDASNNLPRINLKNDATYSITAAINSINALEFRGYTTAYGDGGKATIDGGTTGASYILLGSTVTAAAQLWDMILQNNGATGSAEGLYWNSLGGIVGRVVVNNVRGAGFRTNSTTLFCSCEGYSCNTSNTGGTGVFMTNAAATFDLCIAHDSTGSAVRGFTLGGNGGVCTSCIVDNVGGEGFVAETVANRFLNCDAYLCGASSYRALAGGSIFKNCNSIDPVVYDFNMATNRSLILNCGVGSGTQAAGTASLNVNTTVGTLVSGTVTYPANETPWVDPANGDFRINHASAKGAGHGTFTQTAASYAGAIGYPDIGSAQHIDSGGGGIPIARGMHGGMR